MSINTNREKFNNCEKCNASYFRDSNPSHPCTRCNSQCFFQRNDEPDAKKFFDENPEEPCTAEGYRLHKWIFKCNNIKCDYRSYTHEDWKNKDIEWCQLPILDEDGKIKEPFGLCSSCLQKANTA